MTLLRRSFLYLIRSPGRTVMVVAILAVSLGLALTMFEVHGATSGQLGAISGQIGTEITMRPAGSFGPESSGAALATADVAKLRGLSHVVSVQSSTTTTYNGTALTASVPTNLPGGRQLPAGFSNFRMRIQMAGFDPAAGTPTLMGGGQATIVLGRYFTTAESDSNVMLIGQALANSNILDVGSTVDIEGTPVQVVGIFTSGQRFGDNMIVMPLSTLQRLYKLDGVTSVTVQADDVKNVDTVVTEIRTVFDENTADVVTATQMFDRISSSVTNAASSSQTGMVVSFIVAAAVILLAVLLIVRQRVREIGILKAIGASNWRIGFQFGLETLILSVAAAIVGTGLTFVFAQKVADLFTASNAVARAGGAFGGGPGGGFAGRFAGGLGGGLGVVSGTIGGIHVAISPEIFLIALGIALALAVLASIVPVWYIARVRPAEVLRNE